MAASSPSRSETERAKGASPGRSLGERDGDENFTTAWWAIDVSGARSVIATVAAGQAPVNWVEALLTKVRIVDADQNIVHLIGPYAGRSRMIGQPINAYWPRESRAILADLIVAAIADYPPNAARTCATTSLAFEDATIGVSKDESGANPDIVFLSISGTLTDDRSFWLVRASEERYRNLIHHLPCALLQVDSTPMAPIFETLRHDGITDIAAYLDRQPDLALHSRTIVQVTDANRNAVRLFGASRTDQLIGSVDFLFAASPDTATRVIAAHFEGRRSYVERMKVRRFDGRLRDIELSVTYPTPPERLDVTLLSLEDITDRLRDEAQLRQLQTDYGRAARISMLGELATSIAHEVNQPLSAIVTNAETSLRWLSRDDPNLAKIGQLTERIARSARHASDIVQRIRGMAAPRPPEPTRLDMNDVVDEALLFVRHDLEARSIGLSHDRGAHLPLILGDRVQLQQVVVNLLVNSIQALNQEAVRNARINLETRAGDDGVLSFSIHDNGPGIAPEDLDRVFTGFFTTKEEGMGIGLAICQSIITAHGGTIVASNDPRGGALFRFTLPAAAQA